MRQKGNHLLFTDSKVIFGSISHTESAKNRQKFDGPDISFLYKLKEW